MERILNVTHNTWFSGPYFICILCGSAILRNTRENLQKYGLLEKVQCLESDVFDSIEEQKFDLVFWNIPSLQATKPSINWVDQALTDPGYQLLHKCLRDARRFLRSDGRLVLAFSKDSGDICELPNVAEKYGWKPNCLDTKGSFSPS